MRLGYCPAFPVFLRENGTILSARIKRKVGMMIAVNIMSALHGKFARTSGRD